MSCYGRRREPDMGARSRIVGRILALGRPDPIRAPITEWLELEKHDFRRRAWAKAAQVATCLGVGLAGAIAAGFVLFGVIDAMAYAGGLDAFLTVTAGSAAAIFVGYPLSRRIAIVTKHPKDVEVAIRDLAAHNWFRFRYKFGESGSLTLSEGASLYLRCRLALNAPVWLAANPDDAWECARQDLLRAAGATMGRLALVIAKHRSFTDSTDILEQLRIAATEAERATLARSSALTGPGRDIRSSVARLQELVEAEAELLRQTN